MRCAVGCFLLLALSPATSAGQKGERSAEGVVVSLRGCVSGSLLKSVRADPDTGAGAFPTGDRYRMIGTKPIKARIKNANKAYVEVTGRIKPGPQSVVKDTTLGGTRIGIGVAPGSGSMDQQPTYTPTIEVDEVVVLAKRCDG